MKEDDVGKKIFKARLVVKGFVQKKGINFDEILSLVVKITSIHTILSIVATEDFYLEKLKMLKQPSFMVIWMKRYME